MNIAKFSPRKTGELVPIRTPTGPDYAFTPHPIPSDWELPKPLFKKLVDARTALAKLDGIGRTLPEPELLLSPLKRREAITSSRIEGTYATAQELMLFEISESESNLKNDSAHAWREVNNYSRVLSSGIEMLDTLPFCHRLIHSLHTVLMSGLKRADLLIGQYRNHQVAIGSDKRFIPPTPADLQECMNRLEQFVNDADSKCDPLIRAYLVHYQFEAIHPFGDGNGRIGRVLLALMVSKWCELTSPWLYMSPFFEKYKDEYVSKMFNVSANGEWEQWVDFCLTGTISQAQDAIARCEKLARLKEEMINRCSDPSPRTSRIILGLFSNPIIRVSRLHKTLDVTYPTAQSDVRKLEACNILKPLDGISPKAFFSPEIFAIAYAEIE
jgi:Fic family protein